MSDQTTMTKPEAENRKAAAEALAAESDARRKALELEEWSSAPERAGRRLQARSTTAESLTSLVPDLTGLAGSASSWSGETPLFATAVTTEALEDAADRLVLAIEPALRNRTVLVTDDPDLSAVFLSRTLLLAQVSNQEALVTAATALLDGADRQGPVSSLVDPVSVVTAAVAVASQLSSLFRVTRAVTGSAAVVTTSSAQGAVTNRLLRSGLATTHAALHGVAADGIVMRVARLGDAVASLADRRRGVADPEVGRLLDEALAAVATAVLSWAPTSTANPLLTAASLEDSTGEPADRVVHVSAVSGDVAQKLTDRGIGRDSILVQSCVTIEYAVLDASGALLMIDRAEGTARRRMMLNEPFSIY